MRDRFPVNILIICVLFLFVIYLTSALDLAVTASFIAAAFLFKFRSVWSFLASLTVFAFYLVTIFLSLKIKLITDLSVSSYLFFAAGLLLYFLEGQPSKWELRLPIFNKIYVDRNSLAKFTAILLFALLIFPLTGPYFGAVFAYLTFLYVFQKSEGRYAFMVALFFLILSPFLLIAKKDKIAETSAIFTYYFLVIGVVQEIIDIIRNPQEYGQEELLAEEETEAVPGFVHLKYRKKLSLGLVKEYKLLLLIFILLITSLSGIYFGKNFFVKAGKVIADFKLFKKNPPKLIESVVETIFPSPTPGLTLAELRDKIASSSFNLKISVLNGTSVKGLAASTSAKLKKAGFNNVTIGNTPGDYPNWQLKIKEKEDYLIDYLKKILELSELEIKEASQEAKPDLEIIAGSL